MSSLVSPVDLPDTDALARRNARLLAMALALGGANATINFALGGIIGGMLAPSSALATLPITAFVVGSFATAMPASILMQRIGRKPGFLIGGAIGIAGGLIAASAVLIGSFWLFICGTFLAGSFQSTTQLFRFAAADTASPAFRPKAISWVLAGGLVAAVVGPQIVIHTRDALAGMPFVGPYFGAMTVICLGMIFVSLTRWPKVENAAERLSEARPLIEIARQPRFIGAVTVGMLTYAVMNLVMTAAPLAMIACGHSIDNATLGIQWHVIAMYAPSFVTGAVIARFGKLAVMGFGLALLVSCSAVALSGLTIAHFWVALVLLGLGWNFAYIGATALVGDCHRPSERGKVQGLNDCLVFGLVALASLTSGFLEHSAGWTAVASTVFPAVAVACVALATLTLQSRAGQRAG